MYKYITINDKAALEHRYVMANELGYLEHYYPQYNWTIHHIDGNKHNNDKNNLQCIEQVTHALMHRQTQKNVPRKGKYRGTSYLNRKHNPWCRVWNSRITYNKYQTSLGVFEDPFTSELVYDIVYKEIYV